MRYAKTHPYRVITDEYFRDWVCYSTNYKNIVVHGKFTTKHKARNLLAFGASTLCVETLLAATVLSGWHGLAAFTIVAGVLYIDFLCTIVGYAIRSRRS